MTMMKVLKMTNNDEQNETAETSTMMHTHKMIRMMQVMKLMKMRMTTNIGMMKIMIMVNMVNLLKMTNIMKQEYENTKHIFTTYNIILPERIFKQHNQTQIIKQITNTYIYTDRLKSKENIKTYNNIETKTCLKQNNNN